MAMPGRRPVRCELPHPCGHPAPDCGDMAERWSVILVCIHRTGLGEVIRRRTMPRRSLCLADSIAVIPILQKRPQRRLVGAHDGDSSYRDIEGIILNAKTALFSGISAIIHWIALAVS